MERVYLYNPRGRTGLGTKCSQQRDQSEEPARRPIPAISRNFSASEKHAALTTRIIYVVAFCFLHMAAVCGFSQCLARHLLQRGEDGVTQEATGRRGSGRDGAEGGRQAGEAVQGQVLADAGPDTRLPGTLRTLRPERRRRHQRPRTAQGLQADGISTRQLADRGIIDLLTNSAAAAAAALFGKIQCFAHSLSVPLLGSYLPKRATSYQGRSQDFCLPKVKVKVHTLDIAPLRSESSLQKRSGMARMCSQGISQFYLHTHTFMRNQNEPYLFCLPSRSWYSFTDPGGMEG